MSQLPSLCDNDTKPETTAAGGVRPSRQTRTTRRERQELSVIHALTQRPAGRRSPEGGELIENEDPVRVS
ncbi:hypothetical protein C0Q70_14394 [Pomacea canaliculata]|uniref:Uncharacterized protein n=1 Tax=Pomacea canaliculata TaxID=400727 RepID=A0A2T7NZY6_POMCA|nr:hypothetical protein C0Q70_14394 [Pomacea canaliculata]